MKYRVLFAEFAAALAILAGCGGGSDAGTASAAATTRQAALSTEETAESVSSASLSSSTYAAAVAFYDTLNSSQQSTVQLDGSVDTARHWSNLPAQLVSRNGIDFGSLTSAQRLAASRLVRTALGKTGTMLQAGMMAADNYLADHGGGSSYGQDNYYIAFLGTPSTTSFWMLQITGHHLTFNVAFNGSYKSPTPMFLGIEPKGSFTQDGKTWDPMAAQRTAFSNLGAALLAYPGAQLSGTYSDLLFGANGTGNIDGTCPRAYSSVTDHGLLYTSLSSTDQALVQEAIKSYVNTQATEYASELLATYLDSSALAATYVAYSGTGTVTAKGNYFRIEGPRAWIEFSVQNGVVVRNDIHFHTIWRDKLADYGGQCNS